MQERCAERKTPTTAAKALVGSVELMGLEPTTPCLQSRCSSQLSYSPSREPRWYRTVHPHRADLAQVDGVNFRWRGMVRPALAIRRHWHRLTTLSAERGEEFIPIDLEAILSSLQLNQRQNLALLVACHQSARPVRVSAYGA